MAKKKHVKSGTTKEAREHKRLLFVQAMITNGGNRTQSAIDAGYSARSAGVQGCRMLKEPKTIQLLAEARAKLLDKFTLTAENVTRQLAAIVTFDPRRMVDADGKWLPIKDWPDDVAYAIAGIEVTKRDGEDAATITKHRIWDKPAGIGQAMKLLRMAPERLELDVAPITLNAEINMLDAARRIAFVMRAGTEMAKSQAAQKKKQPA